MKSMKKLYNFEIHSSINPYYGYFKKPHNKLIGKIPMSMIFWDSEGFLYEYIVEGKFYYCYANTKLNNV